MATEEFEGSRALRGKRKKLSPDVERGMAELRAEVAKNLAAGNKPAKDAYRS